METYIETLKETLHRYQLIQSTQDNQSIKQFIQPAIDKLRLEIIELYPWSEEEILEKINTGKVPDAIACCYD
jgi:hypothetical protein